VPTPSPIRLLTYEQIHDDPDARYAKIPRLIMVFVMNCRSSSESRLYAMSYAQMVQVGDALAWTKTASWTERDGYSTRHPSPKLMALLEPHRTGPARWATLLAEQV